MKTKIYISITLLFISSFSIAQKFKTSIMLSPGISYLSSSNPKVVTRSVMIKNRGYKFCFSGTIREEYYFPRIFSLGIGLEYLNASGNFSSPAPMVSPIPEISASYLHYLSVQSLDIPLFLRLRTNKDMTKEIYLFCGAGMSYIFQTNRAIDMITSYDYSPSTKDISFVTKGTITMKTQNNNQTGTFGLLGFGKIFAIKKLTFFCEAKYRFDFNKWNYPTVNDPVNITFDIKRQCFLLSLGITF